MKQVTSNMAKGRGEKWQRADKHKIHNSSWTYQAFSGIASLGHFSSPFVLIKNKQNCGKFSLDEKFTESECRKDNYILHFFKSLFLYPS